MIDLFYLARDLQQFCDTKGWRSCIIGGIAIQGWAEPPVTRDVDVSILTGIGAEEEYVVPLLSRFQARIANPGLFARKSRVLLLQNEAGVGIDISLAALPYEELVIARATPFEFGHGSPFEPALRLAPSRSSRRGIGSATGLAIYGDAAGAIVGIPVKLNTQSEGKPNGIPG